MTEPTLKQWKRRALQAEQQVELLQRIRANETAVEMQMVHELAAARVALREIEDALAQSKPRIENAARTMKAGSRALAFSSASPDFSQDTNHDHPPHKRRG